VGPGLLLWRLLRQEAVCGVLFDTGAPDMRGLSDRVDLDTDFVIPAESPT